MRLKLNFLAFIAASLIAPTILAAGPLPPECRRFSSEKAKPNDLAPRLGRLCVRLIEAHASAAGLSEEEMEAAARLGTYLAIVSELDLRKGVVKVGKLRNIQGAKPTTDTSRYLIADRIGLLEIADRLAPEVKTSVALR